MSEIFFNIVKNSSFEKNGLPENDSSVTSLTEKLRMNTSNIIPSFLKGKHHAEPNA